MDRRSLIAVALIAVLPADARAQRDAPAQGSPLALVRSLYVRGFKEERLPLSAALRRRYQAALANSKKLNEPVSGIDFAWITGAQDEEPDLRKTLAYKVLEETAERARVEASFRNGDPMTVTYSLIREGGRWVIADIAYKGSAETLIQLLDAGAKAN